MRAAVGAQSAGEGRRGEEGGAPEHSTHTSVHASERATKTEERSRVIGKRTLRRDPVE